METINIRQKLHQFIDMVEDKRAEAIYTLFEDEIEQDGIEYSDEFKVELVTATNTTKMAEKW